MKSRMKSKIQVIGAVLVTLAVIGIILWLHAILIAVPVEILRHRAEALGVD